MEKSNLDNFERAVSLAKKIIQEGMEQETAGNCYLLEYYSASGVILPPERTPEHRIKLYEDDGCLDSENINDSYGASCNRRLANMALEVDTIFDALREQLAYELEQGYKISNLFLSFMIGVLGGSILRPKNGRSRKVQYRAVLMPLDTFCLQGY